MSEKIIYLDNNATTILHPEVAEEIAKVLSMHYANPSSPHSVGNATRNLIEAAREQVAVFLDVCPDKLIFTSSGSEANNQAIISGMNAAGVSKIVTTPIEHSSIKFLCDTLILQETNIEYLSIDKNGLINLTQLEEILERERAFVSIQWVNNETGVIQPIEQVQEICKKYNCLFHTDAAQALGKLELNLSVINPDFMTITAHKINGPQGIGALYANDLNSISPLIISGTEEYNKRGGTENLLGIVGFGKACEIRMKNLSRDTAHMNLCRNTFEDIIIKNLKSVDINGNKSRRICNTTNLHFPGINGTALMNHLDNDDIICSQTSACITQIPEPSYVLTAMGLDEDDAFNSLRFSFSYSNTIEEVEAAAKKVVERCRKLEALLYF